MTAVDAETRAIQIEALVRRARALSAEVKANQETIRTLMTKIDELVEVGWKADIDGVPCAKRFGNRKFSRDLAIARMTAEQKLACVTTGIDEKKVREIAESEGFVEDCMVESEGTRIVLQ